ncbi:Internalin-I [Wickerhamomyces ciferrii]|uniref:Internalin-I n=1 Tax=Wickerhamomyces ciferrii (strain ATCC 14091 / BCRC 22168 / CBS 111 / JCM 3599 / NBRC 0793 / NRRL Y-1031 F-60-10) TaxID=1206466 RepID=K0KG40_WICCF|nr:Internalin-I [Wickerhamomyces ciferrii]CCH41167.1 Internalin-I [Wickerhamomyces ciferrii]
MNFTGLPPEIQKSIFQYSYPSDILNIAQNVPELKHLITSDVFKIVTNDVPNLKLKYGLSDDFYLEYRCNLARNVGYDYDTYRKLENDFWEKETNNRVLDPSLLKGFKGAILIEIYREKASLTKFDDHLLEHDPIEIIWHTNTKYNNFNLLHSVIQTSQSTRLKKIEVLIRAEDEIKNKPYEQYELSGLPHGIPPNKLHIPFVKSLHFSFDERRGYSITDMKTIMPNFESLNIAFEDVDDGYFKDLHKSTPTLGLVESFYDPDYNGEDFSPEYEQYALDAFFETKIERSVDFLKSFQLKYFHNRNFNLFENLQITNLEKLVIDSSTIHSIKDLNLPNLKTLDIKNSSIYEISNLNLNSLQDFSIEIKIPHHVMRDQVGQVHSIQNIKSSSLKRFSLTSSFKIKEISKLDFPSLQTLEIKSNHISTNRSFEGIIDSSFPQLENIIIESIPLDNLYSFFHNIPNLRKLNISSCLYFDMSKLEPQNLLNSLILKDIYSVKGTFYNNISLPSLQIMELETRGEVDLCLKNYSFENLKTLTINTHSVYQIYKLPTLTLSNNHMPKLQNLIVSGYQITNHFSTESYPALEELTIATLKSIEISPSNTLKTIDLSKNPTTIEINKSDQLPNLKEYKEPGTMNRKVGNKRRKK